MFGKYSARVLVTGFRPLPSATAPPDRLTRCTDLLVLGQVIHLLNTPDGRPFLKRENRKRGVIHNVCDTKIQFVEAKKSYDFFSDDGSAVTLTENDADSTSVSDDSTGADDSAPEETVELDENLTGRDLLQLVPGGFGKSLKDPEDSAFDEQDLKEGAYFVCRKRLKVPLAQDDTAQRARMSHSQTQGNPAEISVSAGAVGRIDKRAGSRSEPLWIVELLPDSAPRSFWRSLLALPEAFREPRDPALPVKVTLASSQVLEINHFLDHSGVQSTRFREVSDLPEERDAARLPEIYASPELPLEENIAAAQRMQMLAAIRKAALGLRLVPKNPGPVVQRGPLVLEEGASGRSPHLLRRQCFLETPREGIAPLVVTDVDIKLFRPKDDSQVPSTYYAVDLDLLLQSESTRSKVPLVCRFPSAAVDLALVDMAERILTGWFDVRKESAGSWSRD